MKKIYAILTKSWDFIKRHKYAITLAIFTVNIMFFSEYDLITRMKNKIAIGKIKSEINRYKQDYNRNTRILESIDKDPQYIEKIAREKYYMKKDNEDIFIIE